MPRAAAGAAVRVPELRHVHLHELHDGTVRAALAPTLARLARRSRAARRARSRALNHRVKGISMSTFSLEEVSKLAAAGGNDAARASWQAKFTGTLPDAGCGVCRRGGARGALAGAR